MNLLNKVFFRYLILPVLTAYTLTASSTEVVTTLLPSKISEIKESGDTCDLMSLSDQCSIALEFNSISLPNNIDLSGVHFMLTGRSGNSKTITIKLGQDDEAFENTINKEKTFTLDKPLIFKLKDRYLKKLNEKGLSSDSNLSLIIKTKKDGRADLWDNEWNEAGKTFIPRLILRYNSTDVEKSLPEQGIPSTASAKRFMPSPAGAVNLAFEFKEVSSNLYSYVPVFDKGLIYEIVSIDQQKILQAKRALGGPPLWSINLKTNGRHLLLSPLGRLYIVGDEKIVVYKLRNNKPAELEKNEGFNAKPTTVPTIGPDGSLYFVDNLQVYAFNPALQELWNVSVDSKSDTSSRVVLGPSGQFVYLTVKDKGLVVINAQTGEKIKVGDGPLAAEEYKSFHAPIVFQAANSEIIYAVANATECGVLSAYKHTYRKTDNGDLKSPINVLGQSKKGLWSQPLIDQANETIYALRGICDDENDGVQNQLRAISSVDNIIKEKVVNIFKDVDRSLFKVSSTGSNLLIDQSDNVLVWSGNQLFFASQRNHISLDQSNGPSKGSQLLFGSDGTSYTVDPADNEDRYVRALLPRYTLDRDTGGKLTGDYHLSISGELHKDTTVTAPGTVILNKGFKIQRSNTFTVKHP